MPANLEPGVKAADAHVNAEGMRTVGPAYYYATNGEPPQLANPHVRYPPVMSTNAQPVAASILPNPLEFFHKRESAPPREPEESPTQ